MCAGTFICTSFEVYMKFCERQIFLGFFIRGLIRGRGYLSEKHFSCPRKLSPHGITSVPACIPCIIHTIYACGSSLLSRTKMVHVRNFDQVYPRTHVPPRVPPGHPYPTRPSSAQCSNTCYTLVYTHIHAVYGISEHFSRTSF